MKDVTTSYNKPFPQGCKKHGQEVCLCRHRHGSDVRAPHLLTGSEAPPRRSIYGV